MEIIEKKTKKVRVGHETPATCIDGSMHYTEEEIVVSATVKLTGTELERVKKILSLNEKQYRKFAKRY